MPDLAEIGAEIVEVALTFVPSLEGIPVLGRILRILAPGGGNDFKAIEELERQAQLRKTERKTRIDRNNRYVLKASDAMQCVETNLMNGGVLLAIGKGVINAVLGKPGGDGADLLTDRIFTCIESKVLKQTSKRVTRSGKFYHRPSKGHGKGRSFRKPHRTPKPR